MREHFQVKQTIVTIMAHEPEFIEVAKTSIIYHRRVLEEYIQKDPFFNITLEPYECPSSAPQIIRRLVQAGNAMGIGPMSAVAGTISALAVEAMVDAGATYAMVDNGGDIALVTDHPVVVGIYAGGSAIRDLGLLIEPSEIIRGVCTSSATVGPSLNFGMADAAVVFSEDVSLADSAATALSNATGMGKKGVEDAFEVVRHIPGIKGALVIQGDHFGSWGNLPSLKRTSVPYDLITKG